MKGSKGGISWGVKGLGSSGGGIRGQWSRWYI